jgi:hypothetical protein
VLDVCQYINKQKKLSAAVKKKKKHAFLEREIVSGIALHI